MPYLTPDTIPTSTTCRVLLIPDSVEWLAIVQGALQELTYSYNYESYGAATPDECAAAMMDMTDNFAYGIGVCRMVGEIILYGGSNSPDDKLLICDGSSLAKADYPDLWLTIGDAFGSIDADHFNIPNLQDRVPIGAGDTYAIGENLGEAEHTLTESEIPSHAHTEGTTTPTAVLVGEVPAVGITSAAGLTGYTGGDGAHNNIQPSLALTYLIVALP